MDTNYAARGRRPAWTPAPRASPGLVPAARTAFGLALVLQLYVLYLYVPGSPDPVSIPHADKLVHAAVFAVPTAVGVLAGLRPWVVGVLLALHAPVSEMVQHFWLPGRSGEPWDAAADLVGVALGLVLGSLLLTRWRSRRAP